MRRREIASALLSSAAGAAALSKCAAAHNRATPRYPRTTAEKNAHVVPYDPELPPGRVDRYIDADSSTAAVANGFTCAAAQAQRPGGSPVAIASPLVLDANVILPINAPIAFSGAGMVTIPSGMTLTIQGPMCGPKTQIFQANGPGVAQGAVIFTQSAGPAVFPEWWGCRADSSPSLIGTDNTQPLAACIAAAAGGALQVGLLPIVLSDGYYLTGNQLLPPATCIRGAGRGQSGFVAAPGTRGQASGMSAGAWFTDTGSASKIILEDFAMYGQYLTCPNMVYALRLGYNGTQHGTEGYLRGLWIRDCACSAKGNRSGFQCDINGNVGFYDLLSIYCNNRAGQSGLRITGAANICSKLVSVAAGSPLTGLMPTYGIYLNGPGTQIHGMEIEAVSNHAIALSIQANSDINGVVFSLADHDIVANTGKLDHIWEVGANATAWKVTGVNYLFVAGTGDGIVMSGNARRADGTYFGGNATGIAAYRRWDASAAYEPGNLVAYAGNHYQCVTKNEGEAPPNMTCWVREAPDRNGGNGNYFSETCGLRSQTFTLHIRGGGRIQHRISAPGEARSAFANLISDATSAFKDTPAGPDATTAMSYGGKIGSAQTNVFWLDTPNQASAAYTDALAMVSFNSTAIPLLVQGSITEVNIAGLSRHRLNIAFYTATSSAPIPITALLASPSQEVAVVFKGSLSP